MNWVGEFGLGTSGMLHLPFSCWIPSEKSLNDRKNGKSSEFGRIFIPSQGSEPGHNPGQFLLQDGPGWEFQEVSEGPNEAPAKGSFKLINYRINGELKGEVVVLHGRCLIPNPNQKWDWSSSGMPKVKAQLSPTKA